MIYVMYKDRLDSLFFNLKGAEKYINQQKDKYNYKIINEVLNL